MFAIAQKNRDRYHAKTLAIDHDDGALELEFIASLHVLQDFVRRFDLCQMLPQTNDIKFINVDTIEGAFSGIFYLFFWQDLFILNVL